MKNIRYLLFLFLIPLFCFKCIDENPFDLNKAKTNNSKKQTVQYKSSKFFINKEKPLILYLTDSVKTRSSIQIYNIIKKTCDYTKTPFFAISIKSFNQPTLVIPESVKVITLNSSKNLTKNSITKLIKFVAKGGTLFFSKINEDERLNFLLGINPKIAELTYNNNAKGFYFNTHFLPNFKNSIHEKNAKHFGLEKSNFIKDIKVLVTAANNKEYPVIIENKIENGKVLLINSDFEFSKIQSGVLFSTLLKGLEGVPYPIANVNTFFLDDFPSPLYKAKKEPIKSTLNITIEEFVKDVWWPDMISLANKYNLKYTATIIFDYEESTSPPFLFSEWQKNKKAGTNTPISHLITLDFLKYNHELGFHGYNHVSLMKKDWNDASIGYMLDIVRKKWQLNNYKNLPATYIPPSNDIDSLGITSLKKHMPSIQNISSIYTGDFEEGGDREFDPEPYTSTLFDFPRNTSGYYLDDTKRMLKEGLFLFTGIWSHFVHADDVYQIPDKTNIKTSGGYEFRNGLELNWKTKNKEGQKGMYQKIDSLLSQHKRTYPLSSFLDTKTAANITYNIRKSDYLHIQNSTNYQVTSLTSKSSHNWFTFITKAKIKVFENYLNLNKHIYSKTKLHNGFLVNIKTENNQIILPNLSDSVNVKAAVQRVLLSYNKHKLLQLKSQNIIEESIQAKIAKIKIKIMSEKKIDTILWNKYITYNNWEQTGKNVWEDLENLYRKNPSLKIADYSNTLSKKIWYPSKESIKKWLKRQIEHQPNASKKVVLINKYLVSLKFPEDKIEMEYYLKLVSEIQPTKKNKSKYISFILFNGSKNKEQILNSLTPAKDYGEVAGNLMWYFYHQKKLTKALEWSYFSKESTITNQLLWLNELKQLEKAEKLYTDYIKKHPTDDVAKKTMSEIYLYNNKLKKSWIIAGGIKNKLIKDTLQKTLNSNVKYVTMETQEFLVNKYNQLFYPKLKDSITRNIVLAKNNYLDYTANIATERTNISSITHEASYVLRTKTNKTHTFLTSQNTLIPLRGITQSDNKRKHLIGLGYTLNIQSKNKKLNYWSKVNFESNAKKTFYQLGIGANLVANKNYFYTRLDIMPVRNVFGYSRDIYRTRFSFYMDGTLHKFNFSLYTEGNYYSLNNNKEISETVRLNYVINKNTTHKFTPFTEFFASFGTKDLSSGYPYWMLSKRYYGGLGAQYQYNLLENKTHINLEIGHFKDTFSKDFTRIRGLLKIDLFNYFNINFSNEVFVQKENYYNQFFFGMRYYFK